MKKYLKYVLGVAILIVACATFALADGDPVATVNGQPYSSLQDALSAASSGDLVTLVSSTSSGSVSVPSGVLFRIPDGVSLHLNGDSIFHVYGRLDSYGSIYREESTNASGMIQSHTGSVANFYGDSYSSTSAGTALSTSGGGEVNVFGGNFFGYRYAALGSSDTNNLTIYGGQFSSVQNSPVLRALYPLGTPAEAILSDGVYYRNGNDFLGTISSIVQNGLQWISLFCTLIVANKLLLIFILFFMAFAGLGLIKRIIR